MTDAASDVLRAACYVCDLGRLRQKYRSITAAFERRFSSVVVGYSYKTNYLPALCRTLHDEGAYAEVVSSLEYRLARTLGVASERIIFNGPAKSADDIAMALSEGAIINLDSLEEVRLAAAWASAHPGQPAALGLRVSANVKATDEGPASRFGVSLAAESLRGAGATVVGLHTHLSTRARDLAVFTHLATVLQRATSEVGSDELRYLDIGGGFGYAPPDMTSISFPSFDDYADAIHDALAPVASPGALTLVVEPGIALVGDCMSFYAPVAAVKQSVGRRLVVVGGSVHNVKPTRHRYNLPTTALDAQLQPKSGAAHSYDIVGYTCMEDDVLGVGVVLPTLDVGDVLRFDNVGAYTFVFKPPFIRGAPAMYTVDDGNYRLARREDTFEDIFGGYEL
jgi:diaminopimelate decarboxylase